MSGPVPTHGGIGCELGTTDSDKKIVIVRLYGLGNFILALPLIDETQKAFPAAEILLYLDRRCEKIAALTRPRFGRAFHEDNQRAAGWFEREKPDLVLFTYPTVDVGLIASAGRFSARVVAHDVRGRGGAASLLKPDPRRLEAELNLDLLRSLGVEARLTNPVIPVSAEARATAAERLLKGGVAGHYIAVHAGCHGDWEAKRWPASSFGAFVDLAAQEGYSAVLLGGAEERSVADEVTQTAKTRPLNLAGETTLESTAAILAGADVVVSNDSGLMHLAAAVGAPVAAVFGPTSWYKNPPLSDRAIIVRKPLACSPCFVAGGGRPRESWCMEMIEPRTVMSAVLSLAAGEEYALPSPGRPVVSVIVPTRNRCANLSALITALRGQTYPRDRYEIIIVDNDSTDETRRVVLSFSDVRYEFTDRRHSSYAARNHGIRVAAGTVLAFTDDDAIPEPDWIEKGVEWFDHPGIACVAGRTAAHEPRSDVAHFLARSPHLFPGEEVETATAYGVPTVNCFWRRDVVLALGMFDDTLRSGGDFDLTFRLRAGRLGGIRFAHHAVVRHRHREREKDLWSVFARYGYGAVAVARRHHARPLAERWRESASVWRDVLRRMRGALRARVRAATSVVPTVTREGVENDARKPSFLWIAENSASADNNPLVAVESVPIPVPPNPAYLARALAFLRVERPPGLFLYGAGQHTTRAASIMDLAQLGALGVIDDDSGRWGQSIGGLPVMGLEEALRRGLRTVLVSSDCHETAMLERLAPLGKRNVEVRGLYDAAALYRYGRAIAAEGSESNGYVFAPSARLDRVKREALARGLGARKIIVADNEPPGLLGDEYLEWATRLAYRLGRLAGCVRYRYFAP